MKLTFEIDLPDGIELVSLRPLWNGQWNVCLKVGYNVRDQYGSSLGALYASGEAADYKIAASGAVRKLAVLLEEAKKRPEPTRMTKRPQFGKVSSTPDTDELLAELGL